MPQVRQILLISLAWLPLSTSSIIRHHRESEVDYNPARSTITPAPELRRRQKTSDFIYIAPDNICGYVGGLEDKAKSCAGTSETCMYTTGKLGCCDNKASCEFHTTCYNSWSLERCGNGNACMMDNEALRCSLSDYPFCGSYAFTAQLFGSTALFFECLSDYQNSTDALLLTTFEGQTKSWSTIYDPKTTDNFDIPQWSPDTQGDHYTPNLSGPLTSMTSITSSSVIESKSNTPTTGISTATMVGGVIGGLAILGMIGLGAAWLILRERRHRRMEGASRNGSDASTSGLFWKPELPNTTASSGKPNRIIHAINGGMPAELPGTQAPDDTAGTDADRDVPDTSSTTRSQADATDTQTPAQLKLQEADLERKGADKTENRKRVRSAILAPLRENTEKEPGKGADRKTWFF